jgi:hypothetical protein
MRLTFKGKLVVGVNREIFTRTNSMSNSIKDEGAQVRHSRERGNPVTLTKPRSSGCAGV